MLFRVVDIETVPDFSVWTQGKDKWIQVPERVLHLEDMTNAWEVTWTKDEPFPPPQAHRVVAIAWCDVEMKLGSQTLRTALNIVGGVKTESAKTYELVGCHSKAGWSGPADEDLMVRAFGTAQTKISATLVTWNGRTFDLPVLAMRALKLGIPWGWYYKDKSVRYRYSDEGHCDLMDVLSDYGAARQMKLGDAARLMGLPGKTGMDGSKVADVVAQGPSASHEADIARYCLQDAIQTALLFVRTRYHLGIINSTEYAASVKTFAESPAVTEAIAIDWEKLAIGGK
jgi:predicted PolB exonuclease-like 3'-5' exonuclease